MPLMGENRAQGLPGMVARPVAVPSMRTAGHRVQLAAVGRARHTVGGAMAEFPLVAGRVTVLR